MTMRLDEIASLMTLGAQFTDVAWFTFQQIPYILPIAIPVSALISAMLLAQTLSQNGELTALRACGFSLKTIFLPIVIASLFFSLINFYLVSEVSTVSHKKMLALKSELRSVNPLLLLNNKHLMHTKGFYFDTLGASKIGEYAHDVLFFSHHKGQERMNLLVAKKLQFISGEFIAHNMTLLTGQAIKKLPEETVVVENMEQSSLHDQNFANVRENKIAAAKYEHMRLRELINTLNLPEKAQEGIIEVLRRVSVSIAAISLTLMGLAYGMHIGRNDSYRRVLYVMILSAIFLSAFFIGKNLTHGIPLAVLLYLGPHVMIFGCSLRTSYLASCGIE